MDLTTDEPPTYVTSGMANRYIPITAKEPRYKMRQLGVQIAFKGIYFTNLEHVSKDLQIPVDYIPSYLGSHLKKKVKKVSKQKGNKQNDQQEWIIFPSTGVQLEDLNEGITLFIQNFVCCPVCLLPELKFVSETSEQDNKSNESKKSKRKEKEPSSKTLGSCRGCGYHGAVDDREKLPLAFTKYVNDHPPPTVVNNVNKNDLGNGLSLPSMDEFTRIDF